MTTEMVEDLELEAPFTYFTVQLYFVLRVQLVYYVDMNKHSCL